MPNPRDNQILLSVQITVSAIQFDQLLIVYDHTDLSTLAQVNVNVYEIWQSHLWTKFFSVNS